MNLRKLKYFVAVAEVQSFTRAAEQLCIAQPALSKHIKELEEALDTPLFVRHSRPLALTDAGVFFLERCRYILSVLEETRAMTQKIGKLQKTFTIGFVASSLYTALPEVIRTIKQEFQDVEIRLQEMNTMLQIGALKSGTIDIGFGRLQLHDPGVHSEVLYQEPLLLAVPKNSPPLLSEPGAVRLVDIAAARLILFPAEPRPSFADVVLNVFKSVGLAPKHCVETRELQLALGLVAAGEGVCIVPASFAQLQRADISYLPLAEPEAAAPVVMNIRAMDNSPAICRIGEIAHHIYQSC
ncbi:LysR family transcriptional regulator [Uruburuella testudinis]|uniref:LysR family transcriptional regulator n=1 Tax=Uruburuella testudinis TaxID=1282863 RepID=A0ABY4DRA9_9NEIS|nr:LysR family transcriptional regulator [Uruburuella testudinis]UOO80923.1 LysR family transcriptional regulator [Uruburuella testudinis]